MVRHEDSVDRVFPEILTVKCAKINEVGLMCLWVVFWWPAAVGCGGQSVDGHLRGSVTFLCPSLQGLPYNRGLYVKAFPH
ncbi:hypothetical protein BDW75DRAFT_89809 [Aspergillus navahoensis]